MKNFSRMKLQCTIAISSIVTKSQSEFSNLEQSLQSLAQKSKTKHDLGFFF